MKVYKFIITTVLTIFILLLFTITNSNALNLDVGNAHIFSGPTNSYFGYTVAFVKNGKNEKWILIGAPRANDTSALTLTEPGVLYRCQKGRTPSECIAIDINKDSSSHNWMGVSLDVGQQLILVCGHRWISSDYNMNGLCVELGRDFEQSQPRQYLTDPNKQTVNDTLIYSIGAMGMSCAYAPTGQSRVIEKAIGSPGIYETTGGVVQRSDSDGSTDVIHFPNLSQTQGQLYGYTVTYGKLYGGDAYNMITGGPRDSMTGQVKILQGKANFALVEQLPGVQVGSYFGAALATTPLQAGMPEYLLVGAPMYAGYNTNTWNIVEEIGRVYVYKYIPAIGKLNVTQILEGSQSQGSRFGTAISGLNDINGDSYYDIAVGAPYEDEGRGIVYIYNGYQGGFWDIETQKLRGRDISSTLRTFGAAISKPFLYNSDTYYDTLIGAFMSDVAVLIYSQPTINMQVTMDVSKPVTNDIIKRNTQMFNVTLCFSFQGKDLPALAFVEFTVNVDTNPTGKRSRVSFDKGAYNVSGSRDVQKALAQTCVKPYTIHVQSHTDLFVPLVFSTAYKIREDTVSQCSNNVCPTVNTFNGSRSNPTITGFDKELTFERPGCGTDNICQVDIKVEAMAKFDNPDTDLIVGEEAKFKLEVQMKNNGQDWAYSPYTEIKVPEYINFVTSDVACLTTSETTLVCQITEALKAQEGKLISVQFDASRAPVQDFVINVVGKTISSDTNPANNAQNVPVSVKSRVNEDFKGDSFPEIYVTKPETDMKLVTHKFDFENNGPSALSSETEFVVKFPLLRLDNQDLFLLQQFIVVNVSNARNTSVSCWVNRGGSRDHMAVQLEYGEGLVSHIFDSQGLLTSEGNAFNKDCQTENCQSFTCGVTPIPAGFAVSITMNFTLNPDTFSKVQASDSNIKEVEISSVVMINYPNDLALIDQDRDSTQKATLTVLPNKPIEESVAWWIILLSILGAIALIACIIFGCWKCGFFKRKRPSTEESRELMATEAGGAPTTNGAEPVTEHPIEEEPRNGDVTIEKETVDESEKLVDSSKPDEITDDSNRV